MKLSYFAYFGRPNRFIFYVFYILLRNNNISLAVLKQITSESVLDRKAFLNLNTFQSVEVEIVFVKHCKKWLISDKAHYGFGRSRTRVPILTVFGPVSHQMPQQTRKASTNNELLKLVNFHYISWAQSFNQLQLFGNATNLGNRILQYHVGWPE